VEFDASKEVTVGTIWDGETVQIQNFAGEEDGHGGCFDKGQLNRAGCVLSEEMITGAVSDVIGKLSNMGERG